MKILYLVPHVPNPTKVRSYYQIRGLVEAGHQLTIGTTLRQPGDAERIRRLEAMGTRVLYIPLSKFQSLKNSLAGWLRGLPLQAQFMWSEAFMQTLQGEVNANPPDVVHVEHLRMAQYGLRLNTTAPVIWDAVDHLSSLFEQATVFNADRIGRLVARLEAPRLAAYEQWLTQQYPATLVITARDQLLFQQNNPQADRIQVAPFGFPMPEAEITAERSTNTLIITGALNYHPNVASVLYFVREILPLIAQAKPDIRVQLVGANPVPSIQRLNSAQVEVVGFVPSLMDYLRQATMALAPILYGSGLQIKVLEAFLSRTPLVATTTALRGIQAAHREHLLVGNTPREFADAVLELLADADLRRRLGEAGYTYVAQHHDLKKTTANLIDLYRRAGAGGS